MKKVVTDLQVSGKKVLVRVDFNVPHKGAEITDDNRVKAAIPTIVELLKQNAKVVLRSHLGKVKWKDIAKGKATREDIEKQRKKNDLSIVLPVLKGYLDQARGKDVKVFFSKDTHGEGLKNAIDALKDGEVLLVQNTRYEAGEEKNDPALGKEWASYVDAFVRDAFGSAHRAHASTYGVPAELKAEGKPTAVGFLMEKEIKGLETDLSELDEKMKTKVLDVASIRRKMSVLISLS